MKKHIQKIIKYLFYQLFYDVIEAHVGRISYMMHKETLRDIFSYIGIQKIREMLDKAEKNENTYISIADMWTELLRQNTSKEIGDIKWELFRVNEKVEDIKNKVEKI